MGAAQGRAQGWAPAVQLLACGPRRLLGGGFSFPDGDLWTLRVRLVFIQAAELGI